MNKDQEDDDFGGEYFHDVDDHYADDAVKPGCPGG